VRREDWRRYAAPAAFLLAVTIVVVLIRSGVHSGKATTPAAVTSSSTSTRPVTRTTSKPAKKTAPTGRYWTVQAGDTFNVISAKTGVPVATIARLNPGASSTSLFIGEKIRIK
jgi:LysM repeat protein